MAASTVMTLKPLWLQNATNYTALDMRSHLDVAYDEGVGDTGHLAVTQRAAGTNMSVDVAAGTALVTGDSPSGSRSYLVRSDALANVLLDAAPGSNSRIDLIIAEVEDAAVGGGANNRWQMRSVTGTSGASPSPPALPGSAIELAQVTVASGTSAITNAMITDRRLSMHRLARVTANPAQVRDGQVISRSDTGRVLQGRSGSWVDVNALTMELTTRSGGSIFGGLPPANTVYKWEYGTKSLSFTDGKSNIPMEETFTGICWAQCFSIGNSRAYAFSRNTSGTINGDQIPITAIEVNPFGNGFASGTITVSYLVVGW